MTISPVATGVPTLQGKAFYMEFKPVPDKHGKFTYSSREGSRTQVFITPASVDEAGKQVHPFIYDRSVSEHYPRAQWDRQVIQPTWTPQEILEMREEAKREDPKAWFRLPDITPADFEAYSDEKKKSMYANQINWIIKSMCTSELREYNEETREWGETESYVGMELVAKFAVEITSDDIEKIHKHQTPQAIIRRITKTRSSMGLPEKIFVPR